MHLYVYLLDDSSLYHTYIIGICSSSVCFIINIATMDSYIGHTSYLRGQRFRFYHIFLSSFRFSFYLVDFNSLFLLSPEIHVKIFCEHPSTFIFTLPPFHASSLPLPFNYHSSTSSLLLQLANKSSHPYTSIL